MIGYGRVLVHSYSVGLLVAVAHVEHGVYQLNGLTHADAVHTTGRERVFHSELNVEDPNHREARDSAKYEAERKARGLVLVATDERDVVRAVEDREHEDEETRERPRSLWRAVEL